MRDGRCRQRGAENRGRGREGCEDELDFLTPAHLWSRGRFHTQVCAPPSPCWLCVALCLWMCLSLSVSPASVLLEFLVLSGAVGAAWL